MDDTQRIVKCGNLSLHTNGGFFKKRWHSKYLVLYDGSKSGIKRLELFDSEIKFKKQQPAKIIALVDCVRVVTCQRQKTTYTFEVRTNDQFYLLAAQSFQDMNDWVNCLRLVAFGQSSSSSQPTIVQQQHQLQQRQLAEAASKLRSGNGQGAIKDVLLDKGISGSTSAKALTDVSRSTTDLNQQHLLSTAIASSRNSLQQPKDPHHGSVQQLVTASQAAAAAASALAKARQRQPSLLGSCKPQPPTDSPFIQATTLSSGQSFANKDAKTLLASMIGQVDTMTPAVRGQLIPHKVEGGKVAPIAQQQPVLSKQQQVKGSIPATLDEEEENMLYCSIEDNPSEHNYRVKVIETDLSLRCQLKCYQLTASSTISQQYEELGQFGRNRDPVVEPVQPPVTFYQLIIGPQELTLLNDYATATSLRQQQGLWSWPYQCIRRYGFDKDNCFMFEAGRKCTSGPGQFIVQTPKAYNIYQDVVKFVNELRSLTGPNSQHTDDHQLINDKLKLDDSKRGPSVTQIPVTWAPSGATTISVDVAVSRQQFFDSLRQLDTSPKSQSSLRGHPSEVCSSSSSSTSSSASPSASTSSGSRISSTESTLSSTTTKNSNSTSQQTNGQACTKPKQEQVAAKMLSKSMQKLDSAVTPEETDESGYEQGDDAEVSGEFRSKSNVLNVTRKRQANDSMSSASSTSSGGGSPGQTVSRRSGGTTGGNLSGLNSQGPSKRPAINTSSMAAEIHQKDVATKDKEPQQQKEALHGLLSASRRAVQDDFETNLIRDVYSEITKLHAKFAVTSGSAEDIVGSCGNSLSDNASSGGGLTLDDMDDCVDDSVHDKEPVYSNLKTTGTSSSVVSRAKNRFEPDNIDNNTRGKPLSSLNTSSMNSKNNNQPTSAYTQGPFMVGLDRLNMHHPNKTNNSYQPIADNYDNYLSSAGRCGPMYPSILNPIPECAELNPPRNTVGLRSQLIGRTKSSGHLARGNETSYNKDDWDCENIQLSDGKQQQVTPSNPLKSKLPTNHYVINDVQYAKVSRNLSSKFDQCI